MPGSRVPSQIRISKIELALADIAPDIVLDEDVRTLIAMLSSGGDARITLDRESGLNRYMAAPYPRRTLAYASSTANDTSPAVFAHLLALRRGGQASYAQRLEAFRDRLRCTYSLPGDVEVVFAPSGTDLEYVALAAVRGRAPAGIHNVLLGADEVGTGCIHSAHGRFFAHQTALGLASEPRTPVPGLGPVNLADIPVRLAEGHPQTSAKIAEAIAQEIDVARNGGRHTLVHVVHGSKTGLILPEMTELDALRRAHTGDAHFVVDACQARIDPATVNAYLQRGCIVFLSGSKFMGGPPFSGFALVPREVIGDAAPLPEGYARIFRRAEWPGSWPGREILPDSENPGLALRIEAALFELERFFALPPAWVEQVIDAFEDAVRAELEAPLGLRQIAAHADEREARANPIEMRTLATLDLGSLAGLRTFEDARQLHRSMALSGVRLGQPVQCVRRNGEWGPTIRVCLAMPQFSSLSNEGGSLRDALGADMRMIAQKLADCR